MDSPPILSRRKWECLHLGTTLSFAKFSNRIVKIDRTKITDTIFILGPCLSSSQFQFSRNFLTNIRGYFKQKQNVEGSRAFPQSIKSALWTKLFFGNPYGQDLLCFWTFILFHLNPGQKFTKLFSINFISRVRVGYFWSLFWDFYHEIKCMSKSTVIFALGIFWRQTITKTLNNTGQVLKGIWGQRVLIKYKFNRTSFWAKLLVDKKLFLLEFFGSLYFIA